MKNTFAVTVDLQEPIVWWPMYRVHVQINGIWLATRLLGYDEACTLGRNLAEALQVECKIPRKVSVVKGR